MKKKFVALLMALSFSGCCSSGLKIKPEGNFSVSASAEVKVDTEKILHLMGRQSFAQGCPVSPTKAYTNVHVVDTDPESRERAPMFFIWSTESGGLGIAVPGRQDRFRDLAIISPHSGEFPGFYEISPTAPLPGDLVTFVGYDFKNKSSAFGERVFKSRVIRIVGGSIIFAPHGIPGSSGSCVLNTRNQVVGINKGGMPTEDGSAVGIAEGLWGNLSALGEE